MRCYSSKQSLRLCPRLMSRRNIGCTCSVLFCIFIVSFWHLPVHEDVLAACMFDDAPCYPDINQSLSRYFSKAHGNYSMLLTYHPKVNCDHGRYLLLSDSLSSHVYDGTGSQLMWYLGVLNVAYKLNLTLIHLEWTAKHLDDERNSEREKYWQFYDWEIPLSAYQSCPKNSSVRRNLFHYDLVPNQTFDQHHNGKQPFALKSHLRSLLERFLSNLKDDRTGFTLYSSRTMTLTSSLMEMGMVFEIRWWLQHRKLYAEPNGVWAGVPIPPLAVSHSIISSSPCSKVDSNDVLLIGVHIRHGDVIKRDDQGRIISGYHNRYIANSAYAPLLTFLIHALPVQLQNRYLISIYSEGVPTDFDDILVELSNAVPHSTCRISFFLNGRTSETFNRLLRDDVLITAFSTFSIAAGIFNSRQLKIGPLHNRARAHGMRNFLSLSLDANHTRFRITDEKKQLIRRRIDYVWKQKQKQTKTAIPLWLDNYADDYPEDFMLI